jgi:hypothetical protein
MLKVQRAISGLSGRMPLPPLKGVRFVFKSKEIPVLIEGIDADVCRASTDQRQKKVQGAYTVG